MANKDYKFEFDIACSDIIQVSEVIDKLGIRALAFDKCEDDGQAEGIILALRIRRLDDLGRLKNIFESLSGPLSKKDRDITDINQFVKTVACRLPSAHLLGNDEIRFNNVVSKNVRTAA